jgi:ribosome-associated protein
MAMPLIPVASDLAIDESELVYSFARASGPGGQNVNKVETAVHLRFDVFGSPSLDEGTKRRLATLAGRRLTQDGVLVILAQSQRSQERNRDEARERLLALIEQAAVRPKFRVKTRPSLGAKTRRTDAKVRRGETKKMRGRVTE